MSIRSVLRNLSVAVCVVAAAVVTTGVASAADPLDRFAAAGLEVDHLPPGWTVTGDRIEWKSGDGDVGILTTGVDFGGGPCPSGYVCLFANDELQGSMWYSNERNRYWYLRDLGFDNVMSSWRNNSNFDARWYINTSGSPNLNECMGAGLRSEHPDPVLNDTASTVYIYSTSNAC